MDIVTTVLGPNAGNWKADYLEDASDIKSESTQISN